MHYETPNVGRLAAVCLANTMRFEPHFDHMTIFTGIPNKFISVDSTVFFIWNFGFESIL